MSSLSKGGTSIKRPSPHLHKIPTRSNKVSPRTFQTTLVNQLETLTHIIKRENRKICLNVCKWRESNILRKQQVLLSLSHLVDYCSMCRNTISKCRVTLRLALQHTS
jgi:hypothetical protein